MCRDQVDLPSQWALAIRLVEKKKQFVFRSHYCGPFSSIWKRLRALSLGFACVGFETAPELLSTRYLGSLVCRFDLVSFCVSAPPSNSLWLHLFFASDRQSLTTSSWRTERVDRSDKTTRHRPLSPTSASPNSLVPVAEDGATPEPFQVGQRPVGSLSQVRDVLVAPAVCLGRVSCHLCTFQSETLTSILPALPFRAPDDARRPIPMHMLADPSTALTSDPPPQHQQEE